MSLVIRAIKMVCPCFFPTLNIAEYQKRIGETEHEEFMKETFESPTTYNTEAISPPTQPHPQVITKITELTPKPFEQTVEEVSSLNSVPNSILISYSDCIESSHPFYEFLLPKLEQLGSIFDIQATQPEPKVAENEYNLKIWIKQSDDDKMNMFVYSFEFPTTYEQYEEMQSSFELQKSFDTNIDQYTCKEKLDDQTKIIYLAYKKILIVSPRDFVYVRYVFKKGNENWSIATSIPDVKTEEGKTRGSIILTATRAIEKNGKLELTVYSQIDMKMPVKASAAKVRGVTEIKKYLDKCYQYIKNQEENII